MFSNYVCCNNTKSIEINEFLFLLGKFKKIEDLTLTKLQSSDDLEAKIELENCSNVTLKDISTKYLRIVDCDKVNINKSTIENLEIWESGKMTNEILIERSIIRKVDSRQVDKIIFKNSKVHNLEIKNFNECSLKNISSKSCYFDGGKKLFLSLDEQTCKDDKMLSLCIFNTERVSINGNNNKYILKDVMIKNTDFVNIDMLRASALTLEGSTAKINELKAKSLALSIKKGKIKNSKVYCLELKKIEEVLETDDNTTIMFLEEAKEEDLMKIQNLDSIKYVKLPILKKIIK